MTDEMTQCLWASAPGGPSVGEDSPMLGIDIDEGCIRLASLRRRGGTFLLQELVELPCRPQDPVALGRTLAALIERHAWGRQRAVMTLPRRPYFVRRLAVPRRTASRIAAGLSTSDMDALLEAARHATLAPTEQLVLDFRNVGDAGPAVPAATDGTTAAAGTGQTTVVLAAAEKTAVDFGTELAAHCGLKVLTLELRAVAALNGMLSHRPDAESLPTAVAYASGAELDIAVVDRGGIVSVQSLTLPDSTPPPANAPTPANTPSPRHLPSSDDTPAPNGGPAPRSSHPVAAELIRFFNTMKLSGRQPVPRKLLVADADPVRAEQLRAQAPQLQDLLGARVELYTDPQPPVVSEAADGSDYYGAYIPAVGAALEGLAAGSTSFDFLHPRGRRGQKKRQLSWRPFVFVAAALLLLSSMVWLSVVQQRRRQLQSLEARLRRTEPSRAQMLVAKANWNLFRPYLPMRQDGGALDGSRREYLRILGEINRLFPDPNLAYVTNLTISDAGAAGAGTAGSTASDISIRGKVSQGDILPEFIDRLNASPMFQEVKQAGSLTQDPADSLYPFTFSVTGNLRRAAGPLNAKR